MAKVIKEILAKPFWEWPKENNINYCIQHDPLEVVYIVMINPHDCYPTETCGGHFKTLEDAEKSLENNPYGGKIIQTTYGELNRICF